MFYLDIWYIFVVFFETLYEKYIRQTGMSLETLTLRTQEYIQYVIDDLNNNLVPRVMQ